MYEGKSYAENFFLILMAIRPVIHLAAIYPRNPKKIEQTMGAIELRKSVEPTRIPAMDIPNADKLANPA